MQNYIVCICFQNMYLNSIRFNVTLALIAKLVFLVLVVTGHANLVMAIAADSGVAILVILLSLRLFTR